MTTDKAIHKSTMYRFFAKMQAEGLVSPNWRYLVVFAGPFDRDVFAALGYSKVVLADLNPANSDINPCDARSLPYTDEQFDCVVAHRGIHHTTRPHQAICEMYRVAQHAVVFFESQDTWVMRLAVAIGLAGEYEFNENILFRGLGGADETPIPNYVYRWTYREVDKLLRSLDPARVPKIEVFREWEITAHVTRLLRRVFCISYVPGIVYAIIARLLVGALNTIAGRHGNSFAVHINKTNKEMQPWITRSDAGRPTLDVTKALRHRPLAGLTAKKTIG